jgi:hypothetical protein
VWDWDLVRSFVAGSVAVRNRWGLEVQSLEKALSSILGWDTCREWSDISCRRMRSVGLTCEVGEWKWVEGPYESRKEIGC